MKKFYFGTNTKMYMTARETEDFVSELSRLTQDISREKYHLFVIPPFTTIYSACAATLKNSIQIGSQTIAWADEGQFTGEVSPRMVKEVGATLSMIGHSERRHTFHETDEEVNKRVLCALKNDLQALLCIGETLDSKRRKISDEVLAMQIKIGLDGVEAKQLDNVWIAYEPVWAIGVHGQPAEPDYVAERHANIRQVLNSLYGENGNRVPLFYGGSVNPENAVPFALLDEVDGLFIGRSAWNAKRFNQIIRMVIHELTI